MTHISMVLMLNGIGIILLLSNLGGTKADFITNNLDSLPSFKLIFNENQLKPFYFNASTLTTIAIAGHFLFVGTMFYLLSLFPPKISFRRFGKGYHEQKFKSHRNSNSDDYYYDDDDEGYYNDNFDGIRRNLNVIEPFEDEEYDDNGDFHYKRLGRVDNSHRRKKGTSRGVKKGKDLKRNQAAVSQNESSVGNNLKKKFSDVYSNLSNLYQSYWK